MLHKCMTACRVQSGGHWEDPQFTTGLPTSAEPHLPASHEHPRSAGSSRHLPWFVVGGQSSHNGTQTRKGLKGTPPPTQYLNPLCGEVRSLPVTGGSFLLSFLSKRK